MAGCLNDAADAQWDEETNGALLRDDTGCYECVIEFDDGTYMPTFENERAAIDCICQGSMDNDYGVHLKPQLEVFPPVLAIDLTYVLSEHYEQAMQWDGCEWPAWDIDELK